MQKNLIAPKKHLTNASKRSNITLSSVMSVKITYDGKNIECSTAAEAIEMLKFIRAEEKKRLTHRTEPLTPIEQALTHFASSVETSPWTRESFWQFIESVGEAQQSVLRLLIKKHKVSAAELRKVLKLDGNQALAGVLSGISKQAGILNVPARSVYTVEDERRAGELHKTYVAANDFLRIANEMNWPQD